MNTKAIIAIIAVIAIVGAGAGAVVLTHNNSNHETVRNSNNLDGRLTVFGNANNDDFLDSRDVEFVKKVIAGEEKATYYTCYKTYGGSTVQRSFCDANVDGKIDQADVDWIKNMVDRKNNMLLYFYDVDGVIGSCTYPLTTSAVGYKSNYEALLVLGEANLCKYSCDQVGNSGSYSKWYTAYSSAKCYGSRFTPDYETFIGDEPSYILSGTRAWFDPDMEEKCGPLGIDVVRLPFYEDNWTVPAIITLGYLTAHEDPAYAYAEKCDKVYDTIATAIKDIKLEDRPFVYAGYAGNSVAKMHGGVQELVYLAGGQTPLDKGFSTGSIDAEGVMTMNPDWIIIDQSGPYYGFLETFTTHDETKYNEAYALYNTDAKFIKAINLSDAYDNGKVLFLEQGIYMGVASYIACAYVANHIWGDKFNFDVDALLKDYIESYHPEFSYEDFKDIEFFTLAELQSYATEKGIITA